MTEEKETEKKETSETIYNVVEVTATTKQVVEYPDGNRYTFEAAVLDALERLYKLEKKVG